MFMAEIESDKSQAAPISGAADATARESRGGKAGMAAPAAHVAAKKLDEVMNFMRQLSAFEERSRQVKLLVR